MTSLRKIESNRRNALRSTGPRTLEGKQRSSQNARRHGLTAEAVCEPFEDPKDYHAFEQSITADYEATSAVERALVLRVAALLWRLRRATLIETGLLQNDLESVDQATQAPSYSGDRIIEVFGAGSTGSAPSGISRSYRKLFACDKTAFELLGRYEASLWRQLRQTLYTLERIKHRPIETRRRPRFTWNLDRPFDDDEQLP